MPIRFRDRLSYKQARNTVLIAFLLGLFLSLFQVYSDYQAQDRQIDENIETFIAITHTPAARIAYNIDRELASELVQGLIESPTIIHAEILEPTGTPLAIIGKTANNDSTRSFTDMLFGASRVYIRELKVPYDPDEKLGWLKIVADTRPMGAQFLDRALITLATGLIQTMMLSLLLLTIFYLMLTKPLLKLTDLIVESPGRQDDLRIPVPKGHEYDEIGLLTRNINHYLDNISHHLHHRRLAERQLREHLTELESIIARRTGEIRKNNEILERTNKELEEARREAIATASHRTAQLSSLSHEIRTPVNALLGMLEITLGDDLPQQQRKRLSIAQDSGVHLIRLLNDILDLSKLESGKMHMEAIPFDLRSTTEQVVVMISHSSYAKGVPVFCDIDPELPDEVIGDPTRFHQILSNLLGNATKFTHEGHIELRLKCHQQSDDRLSVILSVNDTGIGIPETALAEIFKPFGQASTDTSRKFGGSGIGLPLTQSIVNAMGGKLSVSSEPEEGSTFTVVLTFRDNSSKTSSEPSLQNHLIQVYCKEPLQSSCVRHLSHWQGQCQTTESNDRGRLLQNLQSDLLLTDDSELAHRAAALNASLGVVLASYQQPESTPENLHWLPLPLTREQLVDSLQSSLGIRHQGQQAVPTVQAKETSSERFRILVVEDSAINRMVAEEMLEQLGYEVDLVQNGEECLDVCDNRHYDLIFMDCNMPVMDGFTATRALRDTESNRDIPIIALTANALNDHQQSCLDAGMNDHIAKPFNKQELDRALNKWLVA